MKQNPNTKYLLDLFNVGITKLIGYLPITTIESTDCNLEDLKKIAKEKNLDIFILNEKESNVFSGAVYFCDTKKLEKFINLEVNQKAMSTLPEKSVKSFLDTIMHTIVHIEENTELYKSIGYAFNDSRFPEVNAIEMIYKMDFGTPEKDKLIKSLLKEKSITHIICKEDLSCINLNENDVIRYFYQNKKDGDRISSTSQINYHPFEDSINSVIVIGNIPLIDAFVKLPSNDKYYQNATPDEIKNRNGEKIFETIISQEYALPYEIREYLNGSTFPKFAWRNARAEAEDAIKNPDLTEEMYPVKVSDIAKLANPFGCWSDIDSEITPEEVFKYLDETKGNLKPYLAWIDTDLENPEVYARSPEEARAAHIQKIAYFMKLNSDEPISLDAGIPSMGYQPKNIVIDGNHRLAAAILNGQEKIFAYYSGSIDYGAELGFYPKPEDEHKFLLRRKSTP